MVKWRTETDKNSDRVHNVTLRFCGLPTIQLEEGIKEPEELVEQKKPSGIRDRLQFLSSHDVIILS